MAPKQPDPNDSATAGAALTVDDLRAMVHDRHRAFESAEPPPIDPPPVATAAEPEWVQASAFVVRRNQVLEVLRNSGDRLGAALVIRNDKGDDLGTEPEEWTSPEGRKLLKAMLGQEKTYRAVSRKLAKDPTIREVRGTEGDAFRPDTMAVHPLRALPDRVLSKKRKAAGARVGKNPKSKAAQTTARIQLACDDHVGWSDQRIADSLKLPRSTVNRVRRKNLLKSKR
jgi:hypothetical protein